MKEGISLKLFDRFKRKKDYHNTKSIVEELENLNVETIYGYKQKYFQESKYIWKTLVPKQGQADNLQGELLRQIEKLRYEAQNNGNINWDDNFEYFCAFINTSLKNELSLSTNQKETVDLIMRKIQKHGQYAHNLNTNKVSDNLFDVMKIAYVDDDIYDFIADCISVVYINHPEPITFTKKEGVYR